MSGVVFFETLRRHFTSVMFLVVTCLVAAVAAFSGGFNAEPSGWHALASLLVIAVGGQLIGPEFSSGTLQLIMAKPVNRSAYLLSRFGGVVVAAWAAIAVACLFDLGGRLLVFKGASDWQPMLQSTGGEALHALLACALLALFGSLTRSYFNVAIYFVLNIVLLTVVAGLRAVSGGVGQSFAWLGQLLLSYPQIIHSIEIVHENIFPDVPQALEPRWALMVLSNAAVVLLLACLMFRRREVPYGAD